MSRSRHNKSRGLYNKKILMKVWKKKVRHTECGNFGYYRKIGKSNWNFLIW